MEKPSWVYIRPSFQLQALSSFQFRCQQNDGKRTLYKHRNAAVMWLDSPGCPSYLWSQMSDLISLSQSRIVSGLEGF